MGDIQVSSEIGRLRRVLMHEPGPEIDRMVPVMMEELLFDDILLGDTARAEHAQFRRVLQLFGVEILEARELLAEALATAAAREFVLAALLPALPQPLAERLRAAPPAELARLLVEGVRRDPAQPGIEVDELFEVPPLPNWCFQRDPQLIVGGGVLVAAMAAPARWREALLAGTLFRFHPELARLPLLLDSDCPEAGRPLHLGPTRPRLEGGDVLLLSPQVLAVGHSERTNRGGIQQLARALAGQPGGPRWLLVVALPARRAYMHLDTVFTPVDRDACLIHPPLVQAAGPERARVFEIDLESRHRTPVPCDDLLATLRRRGIDYEPIACGGSDPLQQQREQWTDGANAFALAPGVVTLFDRNVATIAELERAGFRITSAEEVLLGRSELDLACCPRTCVLLPSHELSRARGGPHCLTHPLLRDALA